MSSKMRDYPEEYDREDLDNKYFAEAFPEHDSLAELYRATYKCTPCGPHLSALIQYVEELPPDESGHPGYRMETRLIHCEGLRTLGTWADMDSKGILLLRIDVGSIVEGIDACADTVAVEARQLDEEPEEFARRFNDAVDAVNADAGRLWNDTHGCEECARLWHMEGIYDASWGAFEGGDGITPVRKDCPSCEGAGTVI